MTEMRLRELWIACEGARAGMIVRAGNLAERASQVADARDVMAEWMLAASKGIPIPDHAIADMRMRLERIESALHVDSVAEGNAAEALGTRVSLARRSIDAMFDAPGERGAPALEADPNATTRDISIDEIAEANAADEE